MEQLGLVMVYMGNGKGKTTAAFGQALRAMGHGKKVYLLQFMKGSKDYGEVRMAAQLPLMTLVQSGLPSFVVKGNPTPEDLRLARRGLELAQAAVSSGQFGLVILDEVNIALDYELIPVEEVLYLIEHRPPGVDLVLTGRYPPRQILAVADLVSEIREVRHHFAAGIKAREGIEF
ncbi:MAG: cob(I)yrinic acid a,c-diamide adenosyltransferase [Peptococcaceae bacterium]|nr:cob(I)yrinic acid a,c-diamide adenosyltransferase [Peptococcaceae bacterium]